jgi:hypothetical protein
MAFMMAFFSVAASAIAGGTLVGGSVSQYDYVWLDGITGCDGDSPN